MGGITKRLTFGYVKEYIELEGYELLSEEYINARVPLIVRCDRDHKPYHVTWYNFKEGRRCPTCKGEATSERKKISDEELAELVESEGYKLVEVKPIIKNKHRNMVVKCDKNHNPYNVTIQNFKRGRRCPECKYDNNRLKIEDIREEMSSEGFELVSNEYINNRSTIIIKCPKGHDYPSTVGLFKDGKRCSVCNASKGELYVKSLLRHMGLAEYTEYQSSIQVNGVYYRFDFCVKHKDELLYIEYDGELHYHPVEGLGGVEGYKDTIRRDKIKNNYVNNTEGAYLLRIPYFKERQEIIQMVHRYLTYRGVNVRDIPTIEQVEREMYL